MPRRERAPQLRPVLAADDLRHAAYAPSTAAGRRALLAQVRAGCEDRPGTYRMLGATGLVLYVGKAKRLRTRLLSYFRSARTNRRRDKQARILRHAHGLAWEYAPSEFAALLRELRLIKQHRPRFNVLMNVDEAPRGWLALTGPTAGAPPRGRAKAGTSKAGTSKAGTSKAGTSKAGTSKAGTAGDVPSLRVVLRSDDPEAVVLYGPFRRLHTLGEAARALAEATGVRDCALGTAPAGGAGAGHPRGGCLRAELGACACPGRAGTAAADGGMTDYLTRVAEARDFLAGRTRAPIDTLRARMLAASDAWQFERAAALRERLAALEWLAGRLERFHAGADRLSFVYRPAGAAEDGRERVYLLRRGTVRAEVPAPASAEEEAALRALARRVYTAPDPADLPTHDLDEFYLVASWFRRHAAERARTEAPPE